MSEAPETVAARLRERARRLREQAVTEHADGDARVFDPQPVDPPPHATDDPFPESVDEQLDRLPGVGGLVVVEDGRVLGVQQGYREGWTNPGGAQDPGESLAETAVRETREETNIEAEVTGVLYARDFAIDYGGPERVHVPLVVFTGRRVGGSRAAPLVRVSSGEPEIEDVRWFDAASLPDDFRDRELILELL
ncbi:MULTISPECIES: NUDIX domain-containing protein [Halobacterium]|uniref:NUDIX domain-containing protein n=1 Tax=Halobacterium TaxID=2239 RepID=UPI00073E8086|nr:NUDIX domain-containing protein [Halobacterium sp. CBA1132]MCG1004444.1 NUDIX domain-containing protein [Halobacterium noricense]